MKTIVELRHDSSRCAYCFRPTNYYSPHFDKPFCSYACQIDYRNNHEPISKAFHELVWIRKRMDLSSDYHECIRCNEPANYIDTNDSAHYCSYTCIEGDKKDFDDDPMQIVPLDGTKQVQLEKIVEPFPAFLAEKAEKYGEAFENCGDFLRLVFPEDVQPKDYEKLLYVTRVYDKLCRIAKGAESEENPVKDILGYSMLELLRNEKHERNTTSTISQSSTEDDPKPKLRRRT